MGGNIGFYDNATEQAGDASQSHKIKGTTFWFTLPMSISNQEQQRLLIHDPIWQLPAIVPPKTDAGYVAACLYYKEYGMALIGVVMGFMVAQS